MSNTYICNYPSVGNTGTGQYASAANLIPVIGLVSGQTFLNVLLIGTMYYEGGPAYPNTGLILSTGANANTQFANGSYTDGNLWVEAANTLSINRTDVFTDTSQFNYSKFYKHLTLRNPNNSVQPNTGINTRIPGAT